MKAVQSLVSEHQIISRLCAALSVYAHRLRVGQALEPADLRRFASVFVNFAECIHHEKEESILLPALVRHGVSWDDGVLPMVRSDHRQETYLIDVLRQAGERAGSWNAEARRHISAAARALVEFQANHHLLESTEVFPKLMALDAHALADLERELLDFDAHHVQRRAETLAVAAALIERYAPAARAPMQVRAAAPSRASTVDDDASECCLDSADRSRAPAS